MRSTPTGARLSRRSRTPPKAREAASYEVTIAAPAEAAWAHLATAAGLTRWVGPDATAEPVAGGTIRWIHPDGSIVVGPFLELVPYRRVVFAYGWQDGRMGVPPESTTVEIELAEQYDVTSVRLTHRGLPPGRRPRPRAPLGALPLHPPRHPRAGRDEFRRAGGLKAVNARFQPSPEVPMADLTVAAIDDMEPDPRVSRTARPSTCFIPFRLRGARWRC